MILETPEETEAWCTEVMTDHYARRLGMSDAKIYPFKGMVSTGWASSPERVKEIERIIAKAHREGREA